MQPNPFAAIQPHAIPQPDDPRHYATIAQRAGAVGAQHMEIMSFGGRAERALAQASTQMLALVQSSPTHAATEALRDLVELLGGLSISAEDLRAAPTFWERLFGRSTPLARLVMRFAMVRGAMDTTTDRLLRLEHDTTRTARSLEALIAPTTAHLEEVAIDTAALRLAATDAHAHMEAARNPFDPDGEALRRAADLHRTLEARAQDLARTHATGTQTLATLSLLHTAHIALAQHLHLTLTTSLPTWEAHLSAAFGTGMADAPAAPLDAAALHHQHEALRAAAQASLRAAEHSSQLGPAHTDAIPTGEGL